MMSGLTAPVPCQGLWVHTESADFHADSEDGVGAGGALVHQGEGHCSAPAARVHQLLTLGHAVHGVQGQPLHVHPLLRVLLQLPTGQRKPGHNKGH